MWRQRHNTAPVLADCSDELIWPILTISQNLRYFLEITMLFWLWQTGQFICYKTGQIYLLLTLTILEKY